MCTHCVFFVAPGNPDVMESTLSSTSSSSPRVSPEGMPKGLTRPDSGMLEPGLTQFQRPECNTSNIAAVAAGILATAVSTNSKSAAVDAGLLASAVFAISEFNPLSTILLHRVFLMRWNRLLVVSSYGNLSLPNSCLTLGNLQSTNFRCTFTWSSTANIGLSQSSGNLSLQNKLKCTNTGLSQSSGNLSLQNKLKCTNTGLSQSSGNLSLQNKLKCTNTGLSQSSGNLSLQCLLWSFFLLRPSTNKLQTFNYRVVYSGGPSLIGKNDFYHFLFSTICRHLILNGYK